MIRSMGSKWEFVREAIYAKIENRYVMCGMCGMHPGIVIRFLVISKSVTCD